MQHPATIIAGIFPLEKQRIAVYCPVLDRTYAKANRVLAPYRAAVAL